MTEKWHPVMTDLVNLINTQTGWFERFSEAVRSIQKYNLDEFEEVHNLDEWLIWANDLLSWVPTENQEGNEIDYKLTAFHFVLNQPSVLPLQQPESLLAIWMDNYAQAIGEFLNSTDSITLDSIQSFYDAPNYRMYEYLPNPSGWLTFNQLFARHVKPGFRPVDHSDPRVIVQVADSVFKGSWSISPSSTVTAKGIEWSIHELLQDCPYAEYFRNGTFMHSYLSPMDYHRLHTPLAGKVLWSKVVLGEVYLETHVVNKKLVTRRSNYTLENKDCVGYQFTQARGILILETLYGPVAVLPIGMGLVSSVVMTAEVGIELDKGEEFAYFQFGGSDYIMLFPETMNVRYVAGVGVHHKQGERIGLLI